MNRRLWMFWLLMGMLIAVPLWGQNSTTLSCPSTDPAGTAVTCSVNVTLGAGVTADSFSFGVSVTPNGAAPALTTGSLKYTDIIGETNSASAFSSTNGTFNSLAVVYSGLSPLLSSGTTLAGTVKFTLPTSALGGQAYAVTLTNATATLNNVTVPMTVGLAATITIPGGSLPSITGPASLPAGTVNVAYPASVTVTASGGVGTLTFSATGLPGGLTIGSSSGTISGTPTASGTFSVTATVTDTSSNTANKAYTLTINPAPTVTTASLPAATQGVAYPATTVTATGGTAPYTWSATGLPAGLTIGASTGAISGTPTATGPFSVTVTVTDSLTATGSKGYTLTVNSPPSITGPASLPTGTQGVAYTATTVTATGGTGTLTFSATGLPSGMTISPAGTISGTPTVAGSAISVTVTATDSLSAKGTKTYSLTITGPPSITGPASLPAGTANVAYPANATVTASGGVGTLTFSATGLPGGLTIGSSSGTISGTPSATGTFSVTATVTDSNLNTANKAYSITINAAPSITAPASLPAATQGVAYSATTVTATGGTGTLTFSATGLPGGLTIGSSSGAITGTPTATGSFSVAVTATDTLTATGSKGYTLTVNAPPSITGPASLPTGTQGAGYTATTVTATGGTGTLTFSASGLPPGLTIGASSGTISGTPTTNVGSPYSVTVTATDVNLATGTKAYSVIVNGPLTITGPASLQAWTQGAAYPNTTVTATGGTAPYTWSATGLPSGMTIASATGIISGTPTTGSSTPSSVQVTATDSVSATASKTYSLTINPLPSITTASLPAATQGAAFPAGITLTETGGTSPFSWTATGLPSGLTISSGGTISGTPTATGTFSVTATVTDTTSTSANKSLSLTVNVPPSITGPATLSVATVNAAYTPVTATATGGTGTLTFSATGFPSGMTINPTTGVISGTPTTNASAPYSVTVTVTVTDANGGTGNKVYTLAVNGALIITSPASLPVGITNVAYTTTTPAATGGLAPYTWSQTGLPAGLTFNTSTGTISGTPTSGVGSPFTVLLTVTDSNSVKTTRSYSLAVSPPLSITGPASIPAAVVNTSYPATTVVAAGGTPPYTWTQTGLPPGMSIGSGTGTIGGSPTTIVGSPFTVQVTVTDSNNSTAKITYSLAVSALPLSIANPATLPVGVVNDSYPLTYVTAQGGIGNYNYSATGLPPGLTINGLSGAINGTPTTSTGSPFNVVVTVTDTNNDTATKTYSVAISGVLSIAGPASLPNAAVGAAYVGATIQSAGGAPPITWTATGLSAGLSIGLTTGVISGTPTSGAGSPFSVKVTATDSTGITATRTYTLVVSTGLTLTGPVSLPTGSVNVAYVSTTATAAGGVPPYTWSATGLPSGLTIASATGIISGTPTTSAGSPFTVQLTVTDSVGNTASLSYTVLVNGVSNLPAITAVNNNASGVTQVAPNTWVSIYGTNFASAGFTDTWTKTVVNGVLPQTLDGVTVTVGGLQTYVEYLSSGQINVLLPNVGLGPLQVTVTTAAGTSPAFTVTSQQYSPAFFLWPDGQPVATHLNYTDAAMNGTLGTATVPAAPGETIILWGTGFGPTTPTYPTGVAVPSTSTYLTATPVTVMIGGLPATVVSAVLTSGSAGVYQIAVTVPATLVSGNYSVIASINGAATPSTTLAVQN